MKMKSKFFFLFCLPVQIEVSLKTMSLSIYSTLGMSVGSIPSISQMIVNLSRSLSFIGTGGSNVIFDFGESKNENSKRIFFLIFFKVTNY